MMKKNNYRAASAVWTVFTFGVAVCFAVGCVGTVEEQAGGSISQAGSGKLPKLAKHKPKTCQDAVVRIKELIDGIGGEGEMPEPLAIKIREVIHGTGVSAHSHYYRVFEDGTQEPEVEHEDEHDDEHGEMEESERFHEYTVEPLDEIIDLARWLPQMAADTDIDKSGWESVKAISKEMVDVLKTVDEKEGVEEKREAFRAVTGDLNGFVTKLETALKSAGGE